LSSANVTELTTLLNRVSAGDREALDQLVSVVYPQIRKIAASRRRSERAQHTLQTTDLANEAFLRIFGDVAPVSWQSRAHFFAVVAQKIRFILIEHARKKKKGGSLSVSLEGVEGVDALGVAVWTDESLLALDEALRKLAGIDARAAHGVELRFFGGLAQREIAEVQSIDISTVKRDWVFAKSWLCSQLKTSA
jgi:RNA polymerase sigma factor (TIGR02999 family)